MEKKVLIFFNVFLAILTTVFVAVLLFVPDIHGLSVSLAQEYNNRHVSVISYLVDADVVLEEELGDRNLRLRLPQNATASDYNCDIDYVKRQLRVSINGIEEEYFDDYPMVGKNEGIRDITYFKKDNNGIIDICFDDFLDYESNVEDGYLYLDFFRPKERYEKVIVFDPGHGGNDPGANEKNIYEKNINLDIISNINLIFKEEENIKVYLTRYGDEDVGLGDRIEIANGMEADAFISLHQNSVGGGKYSEVVGTEIMYKSQSDEGASLALADSILDSISKMPNSVVRKNLPGDSLFVLNRSQVPAVLIELGFMSNPDELKRLSDIGYQKQAAEAIAQGVYGYLGLVKGGI